MDATAYIGSNILAVLVMLLLLWAVMRRSSQGLEDQHAFCGMLVSNILLLIFDCGTRLVDGQSFPSAAFLVYFTNAGFYILNPLVSLFYARYCELKLGLPAKRRRLHTRIFTSVLLLHSVLSLLSLWRPILFGIVDGRYVRGPYFVLSYILSFLPAIVAFGETLQSRLARKHGSHRVETILMLYIAPPAVGAILQVFTPNAMIIWVSTMLSMLIIFINLQNSQITTDSLTGLNNRGRLHSYLDWKTRHIKDGVGLYLLMLDIDHFKQVNDRFGHMAGDNALRAAADCLRAGARASDFLARYGGDEFVVVAERRSDEEMSGLIASLRSAADTFNADSGAPYKLFFSIGFARWTAKKPDIDAFIARADKDMYRHKNASSGR